MEEHNKIINQVAKAVLAPHGFFQQGRSRIWLYDCGYFFIQIEFQPSWLFGHGSYCNVGIGFLFDYTDGLNNVIAFNYGWIRIDDFIEYEGNEEEFRSNMTRMATSALEYAKELMKFESLEYADMKLAELRRKSNDPDDVYDSAMVKFLLGDLKGGLNLLEEWKESPLNTQPWFQAWFDKVYPLFTSDNITKEDAVNNVEQAINRRRAYFSQKPSFKKMNKQDFKSFTI